MRVGSFKGDDAQFPEEISINNYSGCNRLGCDEMLFQHRQAYAEDGQAQTSNTDDLELGPDRVLNLTMSHLLICEMLPLGASCVGPSRCWHHSTQLPSTMCSTSASGPGDTVRMNTTMSTPRWHRLICKEVHRDAES